MKENTSERIFTSDPLSKLMPVELVQFVFPHIKDFQEVKNIDKVFLAQVDTFGQAQEFGLLNRLDNDTSGFLYFAKTQEAYDSFKQAQKTGNIQKFYLAQIQGQFKVGFSPTGRNGKLEINYPIMHRSQEKMIAIRKPQDILKGRGKEHEVTTQIELLYYDKKNDVSTLLVTIHKGIRHQIRVHLASSGYPIVGDQLYSSTTHRSIPNRSISSLHLRSIGFSQ